MTKLERSVGPTPQNARLTGSRVSYALREDKSGAEGN